MQKGEEKKVRNTEELNRSIETGMVPPPNADMDAKCQQMMEKFGISFDPSPSNS